MSELRLIMHALADIRDRLRELAPPPGQQLQTAGPELTLHAVANDRSREGR